MSHKEWLITYLVITNKASAVFLHKYGLTNVKFKWLKLGGQNNFSPVKKLKVIQGRGQWQAISGRPMDPGAVEQFWSFFLFFRFNFKMKESGMFKWVKHELEWSCSINRGVNRIFQKSSKHEFRQNSKFWRFCEIGANSSSFSS